MPGINAGYADDHIKIADIDVEKKLIKLATPHLYGIDNKECL